MSSQIIPLSVKAINRIASPPHRADIPTMATEPKPKRKPHHADPEEYHRFLEMAKQVEASEDPKDFEEAFAKVAGVKEKPTP